jgi:flavin reductase (DIM6/NTAB) family NADH-FMN oxidoreductase RutF
VTRNSFKEAMSYLACGVSVLTCRDEKAAYGMTISSLTSVGLNPPTVLVCVEGKSRMLEAMRLSRHFGVTVLREEQEQVGLRFCDPKISYANRFKDTPHEIINGCPLILGGLAVMTCEVVQEVAVSENIVFFGRVTHVESHSGKPLVYFHRDWQKLAST